MCLFAYLPTCVNLPSSALWNPREPAAAADRDRTRMGFLFLSRSVAYAGIQCHDLASRGMRPSRTTVDGCASYRDSSISMGLSVGFGSMQSVLRGLNSDLNSFFIKTYRTITICIIKNSSCRHLLVKNAKKTNVVTWFPGFVFYEMYL